MRQRFDDNKNEKMAPIAYKCLWFDKRDNEKRQSLDKYENDGNDDRYVSLPPIAFLLQKKKIKLPIRFRQKIKNLIYLVSISKKC